MDIILSKSAQRSYSYANYANQAVGVLERWLLSLLDAAVFVHFAIVIQYQHCIHDRRSATKFDTHIRTDVGLILTESKFTHPTPGGAREDFRGSTIQKSGNVMKSPQKKLKQFKTHPTPGGPCGVFFGGGGKHSKVWEMSWTARESIIIFNPHATLGWEF